MKTINENETIEALLEKSMSKENNPEVSSPKIQDEFMQSFKSLFSTDIKQLDEGAYRINFRDSFIDLMPGDIDHICMYLSNLYEQQAGILYFPVSQQCLIRQKIMDIIQAKLRTCDVSGLSVREIATLSRMFKNYETDSSKFSMHFKLLLKVCREISPDISKDNVLYCLEKCRLEIEREEDKWGEDYYLTKTLK